MANVPEPHGHFERIRADGPAQTATCHQLGSGRVGACTATQNVVGTPFTYSAQK
jgi:hypothetical protein